MNIDSRGGLGYTELRWYIFVPPGGTILLRRLYFRNGVSEDAPIFKSRKGNALCVGQIQRIVRKIAEKAGITGNVSPHWLRHSHASHALENGCPIHLVQKQLNHSSISTTGKYLHARPTESSSKYLK